MENADQPDSQKLTQLLMNHTLRKSASQTLSIKSTSNSPTSSRTPEPADVHDPITAPSSPDDKLKSQSIIVSPDDPLPAVQELFAASFLPKPAEPGKAFTEGITNRLLLFGNVLVRINGNNTSELIDRESELRHWRRLSAIGLALPIISKFQNGYVYEFRPGRSLSPADVANLDTSIKVARKLAFWHCKCQIDDFGSRKPVLWRTMYKWLHLLPADFSFTRRDTQIGFKELEEHFVSLQTRIQLEECVLAFCHNDLLPPNIIVSPTADGLPNGSTLRSQLDPSPDVHFIDYEYSGVNPLEYDIANFFNEFIGPDCDLEAFPSDAFMSSWLEAYIEVWNSHKLAHDPTLELESLLRRVKDFVKASHFMWTLWAFVQSQISAIDFPFFEFARRRFEGYMRNSETEDVARERRTTVTPTDSTS